MDRKTLEYMEERAKKARVIVTKIEDLLRKVDGIEKTSNFSLSVYGRDVSAGIGYPEHPRIIEQIKLILIRIITEEIALLESELAEL